MIANRSRDTAEPQSCLVRIYKIDDGSGITVVSCKDTVAEPQVMFGDTVESQVPIFCDTAELQVVSKRSVLTLGSQIQDK